MTNQKIPATPFGKNILASTLLLAALTALTALSIDMSLPVLPLLQHTFHARASTAQLTLSLFLLGYALGQLVNGPLSDRWGRRPVLLLGIAVFTAAGIACAMSTSLPMLIVCRFLQGSGASAGPILPVRWSGTASMHMRPRQCCRTSRR